MVKRLLVLPLALCLALGVATGAHAQTGNPAEDATVLPVWNNSNGKLEAVLLLEPTQPANSGARWRLGRNQLDATWQPGSAQQNHAGELISGAATLKFSVAYLRDFGQ